ncbi:uncharacterized protein LOC104892911 [Beta vulgaris subsp. vulgaris]|uniref:uncharacterized protein LOC104892911 n=1 Tax=Beta vulgaris subsp. vulgaris TaxID=3555 RepID=UPI00203764D4|nr:uncharacterized protein LOC104892911 [Beta vulgaris subsp. vulgaris]
MSLNCCHVLQRTDSDFDMNKRFIVDDDDKSSTNKNLSSILRHKMLAERSWSGNLMPPCYDKVKPTNNGANPKKLKMHHRRHGSTGAVPFSDDDDDLMNEPKLVRSGGIRRDWSFENLEAQQREARRSKQR